jgi:hypothetical protein
MVAERRKEIGGAVRKGREEEGNNKAARMEAGRRKSG